MPAFICKKGCMNPPGSRFAGKPRWHQKRAECPFEPEYTGPRSREQPPIPEQLTKPVEPGPSEEVAIAKPTPSTTRLTFPARTAEVIKGGGGAIPAAEPEEIDFIVDGPHTIAFFDFTFGVVKWTTYTVDDWLEYSNHIPEKQFHLSSTALMSIQEEERNWYSRIATRICKWAGAKTRLEAHGMIDGLVFLQTFGGLAIAIVTHYRVAFKESPKLKRRKEEKARKAQMRAKAVDVEARTLGPEELAKVGT